MNRCREQRWVRHGCAAGIALLTALVATVAAAAQQGAIQGQVTDQATLRPLNAVQVYVEGQTIGTLTDAQGRFRLDGVPVGEVVVRAQLIGYSAVSVSVTVPAEGSAELDFELRGRAIDMDEIVVTGTGAPAQRRQLGQTINSVSAQELELAPITSVADALQGRVPGMLGQAFGETGAASQIILRGTSSLSLRNSPLIYVDGVRMDNRNSSVGGVGANRLADINPADIERIEVIKGAAAATLFGTEASSGVIQIFTRRGSVQAPVYTFSVDQQIIHMPHSKWPYQAGYRRIEGEGGSPDQHVVVRERPAESWIDLGHHQSYTLAVRGGSPGIQYSLSGRFMDEDGTSPNHFLSNNSLRSAFDFIHSENLRSSVDLSVVRSELGASWPQWSSIASDFLLANPANANERFTHGESEMPVAERLSMTDTETTTNVAVSGMLQYSIGESLMATFRVGHNDVTRKRVRFAAEGDYNRLPGVRQIQNRSSYATTVDLGLNWSAPITDRIVSNTTFGAQSFWEGITLENAQKSEFSSPTLSTLTGASVVQQLTEATEDVINAGMFVQQQFGLDNRLFLTLGARWDGNSAFGEETGLSTYPKAGLSWVVSDHAFWNIGAVDELRLRGAIGSSGLQPGAFDAQRTWNPASFGGGIARITPNNLGNPDLKPERSTERELAVEAVLFGGRLGLEAIYFNQVTSDALMDVAPPPSTGFKETQLRNIGELKSSGVELMGDLRVLERPRFSWTLNAAYTYIDQKITDMGGIPDIRLGDRRRWGWLAEGHRPGVLIAPKQDPDNPYSLTVPIEELTSTGEIQPNVLRNPDDTETLVVHGDALPSWTVDFGSTFRLGQRVSVRALFTGAGGFLMSNETEVLRTSLGINEFGANVVRILADPNSTVQEKQAAADAYGTKHWGVVPSFFEKGDWLKLNELTLTYEVPLGLVGRLGLGRTSVTFGGRNVALFTKYSGILDPSAQSSNCCGNSPFEPNIDYISAPTPRRYVFSIRTSR